MTSYVHLRRYGKPRGDEVATVEVVSHDKILYRGRTWDLRTGLMEDWFKGFAPSRDGRYLRYTEGNLQIVYPDGRVIDTTRVATFRGAEFVGPYVVVNDDYNKPPRVIDLNGRDLGRLPKSTLDMAWCNPYDGKSLWFVEDGKQSTIVQYHVASQQPLMRISALPGTRFKGIDVLSTGHVITSEVARQGDNLVLFAHNGARVRHRPMTGPFAALGHRIVMLDTAARRFVIYDPSLEPIASLDMFEPGREISAKLIGLPSGREWIVIGGRGEWDHYGEPGLGPAPAASSATPKPASRVPRPKSMTRKGHGTPKK